MRNIISLIAVFILIAFCPVALSADDLTTAQKNFRSSIMPIVR